LSTTPLALLRESRLQKLHQLRQLGLNPFVSRSRRTDFAGPIQADFAAHEGRRVTVGGRLMSWRKQGALAFGHIQDQTGSIQLFFRRNLMPETDAPSGRLGYADLNLVDVGDIVEAAGVVTRTQRGEISVLVDEFAILTKSLRPPPDKWSGLKERETILRKRYLQTVAEPQVRARFEAIARMLYAARVFLNERGFLEFHTPVLQPQYGGGTAQPFLTRVNALGCSMYLAISHELYLKRLIVGGFDKVYTIGRYFRNEGIDRNHQPEFSMIETMTAYENYEYNMALVEDLFRHIAREAYGKMRFQVGGHEIDFEPPWRRVSMAEAVLAATGVDFRACASAEEANTRLASLGIHDAQTSAGAALVRAFEGFVERTLIQPTLVWGHPVEISPLAKPMQSDPRFAERFEIFIAGMECGDNWSEQNDPVQLLERWRAQDRPGELDTGDYQPLDYDFLEALEYGMPPTTGIGPGIERMAMIFTGQENIDDVVFFPILRPHVSQVNRAIYGIEEGEGAEEPGG